MMIATIFCFLSQLVMDRVPETWVLDVMWTNGTQVEQEFSLLFAKFFGLFDDSSKWSIPNLVSGKYI